MNVLPKAGGTLNQDPEFMRDMRVIIGVENSLASNKAKVDDVKKAIQDKMKNGS